MMLRVVEDAKRSKMYQEQLERTMAEALPRRVVRTIGYPGGRRENAKVCTDGIIYYCGGRIGGTGVQRNRNWFGPMRDSGNLRITFEANTPTGGFNGKVQGFFAEDQVTGSVYLMHAGGIGGGRKGVGKRSFLAWLGERPHKAARENGKDVHGLIVMPLQGKSVLSPAIRYMRLVGEFKAAVRQDNPATIVPASQIEALDDYYEEATGRRRGHRQSTEIDYPSRHGEVVDALKSWRAEQSATPGYRFMKNVFVDLALGRRGRLSEMYEVKTSRTRSDVYGAIGQLLVHRGSANPMLYLVLPGGPPLSKDVTAALKRLEISVLWYEIEKEAISIDGPLARRFVRSGR